MGCVTQKGVMVRPTCPDNHSLKYLRRGQVIKECSYCKIAIRDLEYLACEECSYYLCIACSKVGR